MGRAIRSAALAQTLPLEGDHTWGGNPEGASDWRAALVQLTVNFVTPDCFRTMGIPFAAERNFAPQEYDRALSSGRQRSRIPERASRARVGRPS